MADVSNRPQVIVLSSIVAKEGFRPALSFDRRLELSNSYSITSYSLAGQTSEKMVITDGVEGHLFPKNNNLTEHLITLITSGSSKFSGPDEHGFAKIMICGNDILVRDEDDGNALEIKLNGDAFRIETK